MKTRTAVLLCVAGGLQLLIGCTGTNALPLNDILLGIQDSGTTVHVRPADRLTIILSANPSTGYSWVQTAADANLLTKEQDKNVPLEASAGGAVGQPVVQVLVYSVGSITSETTTPLILEYRLADSTTTIMTFYITVDITP